MTQTRPDLPKRVSMSATMFLTVCRSWVFAGPGAMGQGEALAGQHQGNHDLFAVATMVTRVATLGQLVVVGQSLEIGTGQIVEQQIVIELKEGTEPFFDRVFDGILCLEELIERAIETVLGDGGIRHA